jgi:RNase H-fold protein (predicted Holliday junction resolvase)
LQICASGIENFVHEHNDLNSCVNRLIYWLKYYRNEIKKIVIGNPISSNANHHNKNQDLVNKLQTALKNDTNFTDIEICLQDENFTTSIAINEMKTNQQLKYSQIKKNKDKISAVIILERYLKWNY